MNPLEIEKAELLKKLEWLGVRSTGSERIEKRIKTIDTLLARQASIKGQRDVIKWK